MSVPAPLLAVRDLRVSFRLGRGERAERVHAVREVSFALGENRTLALVGESGSGKSVTAMAVVGLLPGNAEVAGEIVWRGEDLRKAPPASLRARRGREIACVFQDPMSSLNPVLSVAQQLVEPLRLHRGLARREARERAEALLDEVGIAEPGRRLDAYPHQLSGGQQQRVMIAMALACEPRLLIADEPTTALDVTIQRQILELLATLQQRHRMSLLFISHDLGVVGEIADEVVVMRHGRVREQGPAAQIFTAPRDAYTRALLACRPRIDHVPARLPTLDDALAAQAGAASPRPSGTAAPARPADTPVVLEVRALTQGFWQRDGLFGRRERRVVDGVSFSLRRGRTLGVVGESGSGKTTMGLGLLQLLAPEAGPQGGEVLFDGRDLRALAPGDRYALRRRLQIVFQNPYASLNPRFTIGQTLTEPMAIHGLGAGAAERERLARGWLERVGLSGADLHRYPHEFSGGQRQRIAIARCLTLGPEVLVLDEAVSALDVSVQAQVLNLLRDLQDELGLAYVFISHDLAVVRFVSDDVLVMKDGRAVEHADAQRILTAPGHDYTRALLAALPRGYRAAAATRN